ncbi:MAG: aldose 1-epimerase [Neisseria sp.]|nr:aldose 1-epimerase [Neisseria sp.]
MFTCHTESERVILRCGQAEAEIYLFGALLNRYAVREEGRWFNCVRGYSTPSAARASITNGFYGAKLSPFPCRLKNGRYRFNGQNHHIAKHQTGGHALHGLLYDAPFGLCGSGGGGQAWAELAYDYDGTTPGYPFPYRITVRYTLGSDGLTVHTAVQNTGSTPMPLADGWHPYFTLGGSADEWELHINSRIRLTFDQELLPTGGREPDTRFWQPRPLAGISLDNSFLLNEIPGTACILKNGRRRLTIKALHNYPVLQIYIPPERDSVAVENLSGAPDCFNNGLGLLVLAQGEEQVFSACYSLYCGPAESEPA